MDGRVGVFIIMMLIAAVLEASNGCEEGVIRLLEVQNKFKGLVEVCQGGKWKTVCNRGWDDREARVVCRQLGFAEDARVSRVTYARVHFELDPRSSDQEVINMVWGCTGNEQQLLSCPQTSSSQSSCTETGVYCYGRTPDNCQEDSLRLANRSTIGISGRVEVCLDGFWGTVCDDGWDVNDATTVCRQLGLSDRGVPTRRAFFGEGRGPVHLSTAGCTSEDMNLLNCTIDMCAVNGCNHSEDAGVICSGPSNCSDGDVRLMGGENELEGRVEICYNGVWGTVCDNGWDERDATVVCNQLGFGQPGMLPVNQSFGAGMGPILLDNVICSQSHLELLQCVHPLDIGVHECDQENVAGVICPNVSTTTAANMNNPSNITTSTTTTLDTSTSEDSTKEQNAAIFGAVGGALAMVMVAIVLSVVVTVVMIATKRRKPNVKDITGKDTRDIDLKINEVYGITNKSVTIDDIKVMPNEVYGVVSGDHHGVSSCQRWL